MLEINGKEYKLNQIVCVGYMNNRNCYEIVSGRIMDYDSSNIWLDTSYDFVSMEDTEKVKKDSIKYIKVTINNLWR
ncbi:MAG: hypothetical protein ACI4XM_00390 [Candidatus Coprovivens sp.]